MPTVLTPTEVNAVFQHLSGPPQLIIKVLYGTGLRRREGLRLRVKDLDFAQGQIVMRDVKGHEGRVPMLPQSLVEPLTQQLQWAKRLPTQDLEQGYGAVYLPKRLRRGSNE